MSNVLAAYKWEALWGARDVLLSGLAMTVGVSLLSIILMLILGLIFGLMSTSRSKVARAVARVYVEVIQNTPLVIQVFILYAVLPLMGIEIKHVFIIGVLGVGVYHGAYMAEIVRGSIDSIPQTQFESGRSQGFTYFQYMRYIIIPQAFRLALPPTTNLTVALIKNTSVLALIAGGDLLYNSDSWSSVNLYWGPAYIATGVLYFLICFPLAFLSRVLERKLTGGSKSEVAAK